MYINLFFAMKIPMETFKRQTNEQHTSGNGQFGSQYALHYAARPFQDLLDNLSLHAFLSVSYFSDEVERSNEPWH